MVNGAESPLNLKQRLLESLGDTDYRRGFVEGHTKDTIAFQLRALRKTEGWEQRDVAEKLGNPKLQPMISRYENPDYGRYSISTLLELAEAFDVALVVRFVPFSELVEWDWNSGPAAMSPKSFAKDEKLLDLAAQIRKEQNAQAAIQQQPNLPSALGCVSPSVGHRQMRRQEFGSILRGGEGKAQTAAGRQ